MQPFTSYATPGYDIQQKNFIQGPVIITQYKERADDLVTEAESKLRSVLN